MPKLLMMKKYIYSILLAALLGACTPTPPETVAVNMFNALSSGNLSYVRENIYFSNSSDYYAMCDFLELAETSLEYKAGVAAAIAAFSADYKVVRSTRAGDEALVELSGSGTIGKDVRFIVRLLFIDGRWVVDGEQSVLNDLR